MSRFRVALDRFAFSVAALQCCMWMASVDAGMPALLPSSWTAESSPDRAGSGDAVSAGAVPLRIQTISFFVAVFLLSGWLVKGLEERIRPSGFFPRGVMPRRKPLLPVNLVCSNGLAVRRCKCKQTTI